MDSQDPTQRVIELAGRVKAGTATPRDVALLTGIRNALDPNAQPALISTIDDALAHQSTATDWAAQPESTAAVNERIAAGQGGGGGFGYDALPPETPPQGVDRGWGSPFDALGALGTGAATTVNSIPDPVGAVISSPTQGSALAQDNPWDVIGQNVWDFGNKIRELQGTDLPSGNQPMGSDFSKPSVSDPGTLPPTQKPPTPDPLAAYETAPESASLGTHMPGDIPVAGMGASATQTNWKDERRAMREGGLTKEEKRMKRAMGGADTVSLSPDSAFAGVTDVADLAYQPEMMARMLARKMGGGAMTAAMILPEVQNAMALVQSGQIGGGPKKSGLGSSISTVEQLEAIESFVTQMSGSQGRQVDPYASYQEGLKRAIHTPEEMLGDTGDAESSRTETLAAQIKHTNDALLAGAGGMGPGAAKKLNARLKQEANEWLDLAMRSAPGTYVTYPQFLKERGAKTWFR